MGRLTLRGALHWCVLGAASLALLIGCSGGDGGPRLTPSPAATSSVTGTPAPSATGSPTESATPDPEATPQGASQPTGIAAVDAVIAAVEERDADALARLTTMQSAECVGPETEGLGGPPRCETGEAVGTVIEVFPLAYCEGTFVRDAFPALESFVAMVTGLHSVVEARSVPRPSPIWHTGDYWINFTADFFGQEVGVQLVVEDDALVLVFFGCLHTPESLMQYRGLPLPVILAPPTPPLATFEDGKHFVFIRGIADDLLIVDPAEFLTGAEATTAAREDGAIGPDETPPNDFYIRNPSPQRSSVPLAAGVGVTLIGFDTDGALDERNVALSELVAVLEGSAEPDRYYGYVPGHLPAELTLEAGQVSEVIQQYVP
jgi:hypothetical protein